MKCYSVKQLLLVLFLGIILSCQKAGAQVKILFDATKAETAGNADWVIDADVHDIYWSSSGPQVGSGNHGSDPQQVPTPLQSSVTGSTTETYWEGAISNWGIDCVNYGYEVETLPYNGLITYGDGSNPQDLSNYKVFVMDEPNIRFTTTEKTAILAFVQNGGGLFMISDHNMSDRNNDGWDSPNIWNDFMSTVSPSNPFGITFDLLNFSQTSSNLASLPNDSLLHGPYGTPTGLQFNGATSMTLDPNANSSVQGVIFTTGSSTTGTTGAMMAHARYGTGKVAAISDSSPFDDGTGNPSCTLYSSYSTSAGGSHQMLIMNATIWLASDGPSTRINTLKESEITIYPNPSSGIFTLQSNGNLHEGVVKLYDVSGNLAFEKALNFESQQNITLNGNTLATGIYTAVFNDGANVVRQKLVKIN